MSSVGTQPRGCLRGRPRPRIVRRLCDLVDHDEHARLRQARNLDRNQLRQAAAQRPDSPVPRTSPLRARPSPCRPPRGRRGVPAAGGLHQRVGSVPPRGEHQVVAARCGSFNASSSARPWTSRTSSRFSLPAMCSRKRTFLPVASIRQTRAQPRPRRSGRPGKPAPAHHRPGADCANRRGWRCLPGRPGRDKSARESRKCRDHLFGVGDRGEIELPVPHQQFFLVGIAKAAVCAIRVSPICAAPAINLLHEAYRTRRRTIGQKRQCAVWGAIGRQGSCHARPSGRPDLPYNQRSGRHLWRPGHASLRSGG